ncbi:MAG: response regulator transcription factor [Deltaproteobacteria bacterium]|nr:MAG: response regulator transcription factor [Deltaproteobacteria bacterium]TMQ20023.1 MAG: response regulator transcription factor [Deltaproteobacteria bacterium]
MKAAVAVVDDHPLFREGLAAALHREIDLAVVGEAANAEQALELANRVALDVAVVDVLMPTTSGISLTSQLFEIQPRCRVLGLSVIDEPGLIADMLRAHACGYALKTQPTAEIVDAIRQVLGGLRYLPPGVSRDAVDIDLAGTRAHPFMRLTPREREVFELLIRGHSNDEVASKLSIARRTVETHRQRIMNKLSAHSVVQMQRIAALHGGW